MCSLTWRSPRLGCCRCSRGGSVWRWLGQRAATCYPAPSHPRKAAGWRCKGLWGPAPVAAPIWHNDKDMNSIICPRICISPLCSNTPLKEWQKFRSICIAWLCYAYGSRKDNWTRIIRISDWIHANADRNCLSLQQLCASSLETAGERCSLATVTHKLFPQCLLYSTWWSYRQVSEEQPRINTSVYRMPLSLCVTVSVCVCARIWISR